MPKKIRPSSKYWRRREEAQQKKNIKDQKEYDKRIKSIYLKAMDNIQKEIDSFYARYAKKEGITLAEAKKRASKLDMEEYSRKAKRYVDEKDFSKEANDEMRLYNMTMKVNRLELLKAKIGLELVDSFNDLQKYFDQKLTERTLDEFKRQAGILGDTVVGTEPAKRARVLVNASFRNAKWSDRIWMYQDLLKNKLDNLLRTGMIQGRNSRDLARDLRKAFDVSRHDAERLMRTEMARVQTDAQKDSFERNGFEEYEYICCGLPDACEICRALDGKIFKVKDMMPGENAPPMHPNDHCSTAAHYANRDDFDAWLDAKAAGETGLGFEEWRNGTSASAGDEVSASKLPPKFGHYIPDSKTRQEIIQKGIEEDRPIFDNGILGKLAKGLPSNPNRYDVVMHGHPYCVEFFGKKIDVETLCAIIAQRKDYKKGTDIRLISCYTGSTKDGVAQYVANKLGVTVWAPDKLGIINRFAGRYRVYSGSEKGKEDGSFIPFYPIVGEGDELK